MASLAESRLQSVNEEIDENFVYAIELSISIALPMALHTAIELGIFKIIADEGQDSKLSAAEIVAKMVDVRNPDAPVMLDRILRLLASHKVIGCSLNGLERQYSLTPVSKYFVPNKDGVSLGPFMGLFQDKVLLDCWTKLKDSILEGGSAFQKFHGTHCFGKAATNQRFNQVFNAAMLNRTNFVVAKLLNTYKGFEHLNELIDIGGGLGQTLNAVTAKYPHLKGINFDLPHVVEHAPAIPGVEHVSGDMFKSVPKGGAIFMKSILHDWGDDYCLKLLKNCYNAIPDDGKVIVMDEVVPVIPESNTITKANFYTDLVMMAIYEGGTDRTEYEYRELGMAAGFRGIRFVCRVYNYCVMEFIK